jgi:hypothetical protein
LSIDPERKDDDALVRRFSKLESEGLKHNGFGREFQASEFTTNP